MCDAVCIIYKRAITNVIGSRDITYAVAKETTTRIEIKSALLSRPLLYLAAVIRGESRMGSHTR